MLLLLRTVSWVDKKGREVCLRWSSSCTADVLIPWDYNPDGPPSTETVNVANVSGRLLKLLFHEAGVRVVGVHIGEGAAVCLDLDQVASRVASLFCVLRVVLGGELKDYLTGDVIIAASWNVEALIVLGEVHSALNKGISMQCAAPL